MVRDGLVKNVGVSNYYPHQTKALQKYLETPIVSNQISLSLLRLDPIYEGAAGGRAQSENATCDAGDGVLDQCEEMGITPLAYSPLGGGWLSGRREVPADNVRVARTLAALREMGPTVRRRHARAVGAGLAPEAPVRHHPAGRLQRPRPHPGGRRRGVHRSFA